MKFRMSQYGLLCLTAIQSFIKFIALGEGVNRSGTRNKKSADRRAASATQGGKKLRLCLIRWHVQRRRRGELRAY